MKKQIHYEKQWIKKLLLTMKMIAILSLCTVIQLMAADTYAQKTKLSLNLQAASIEEVLLEIEKQSEFYFLYNNKLVDVSKEVSVDCDDMPIHAVLDYLFKEGEVKYYVMDRQIILSPQDLDMAADSQQGTRITGTVTDTEGNPLPGVNIVEKGTTNGAVTDLDGNYSITVSSEDAVLSFSFVGYLTEEIEVGGQTQINVTLIEDIQSLDEVVVIGYGTMKKSDITGSVSSVSMDEMASVSVSSVEQLMQGRAAGVQITSTSGGPGAASSIKIRGVNSINSSSEPLYVIDGVPIAANSTGDISASGTASNTGYSIMSTINPGDIESIEILKDASSTAIYGSRGANGVILISTKRGETGRSKIDFNANYGVSVVPQHYDILGAEDYKISFNEYAEQEGVDPIDFSNYQLEDNNWPDLVMRNGVIQNYQLSVNGGDERTNYYISGSYYDEQGVLKESQLKRYTGRLNVEHKPLKIVTLGTNLTYAHSEPKLTDNIAKVIVNALDFAPIIPQTDPEGEVYYPSFEYIGQGQIWSFNPLGEIYGVDRGDFNDRLLIGTYGSINITDALSIKSTLGIDLINATNQLYSSRRKVNLVGGRAEVSQRRTNSLTNSNQLIYQKVFGGMHDFTGTIIHELTKATTQSIVNNWDDFPTDALSFYGLGAGVNEQSIGNRIREWTMVSFASRLNYIYASKYMVTFTARQDGSSRFGADNKWGFFPSGALAWRVSEEPFMNLDAISNLKLRASYGKTGNTDIGLYNSIITIASYPYSSVDLPVTGYYPTGLANEELQWETTTQTNIGLDLGLFDNRLNLTADYFNSVTDDLLLYVNIPHNTGYGSILKNAGSVENNGVELTLDAVLVQSEFQWNISSTFTRSVNNVTDLGGEHEIWVGGQRLIVGQPLQNHYGFVKTGIFQTEEEILTNPSRSNDEPGVPRYQDVNEDGRIDGNDQMIIGRGFPDFYYGLTSNMKYKGFDLFIYFSGVEGVSVFNQTKFKLAKNASTNRLQEYFDNRWTPGNPSQEYPRTKSQYMGGTSEFLEDGSFIRLKTLTLGYNIPVNKLNWMAGARLYVTGQNLFTITDYSGYDPEVNNNGQSNVAPPLDEGAYPRARTFSFGVNLNF